MAWEYRGHQQFYYRSKRINGYVTKVYYGSGHTAQIAYEKDLQQQEARERERVIRKHIELLDSQTNSLRNITRTIINAHLLLAGFYQHKRTWRRKRQINQDITYGGSLMIPERKRDMLPLQELEELV